MLQVKSIIYSFSYFYIFLLVTKKTEKESLFSAVHSVRASWVDSSCRQRWMSVHYMGWESADRASRSVTRVDGKACYTNKQYQVVCKAHQFSVSNIIFLYFCRVEIMWTTMEVLYDGFTTVRFVSPELCAF